MKKVILILLSLSTIFSCGYENPGAVTDILLTDEVKGSQTEDNISLRYIMTYNSNGASIPSYDAFLGYDVYVINNSSNAITNVFLSLESTNPTGFDYNGSNEQILRYIGTINSGSELKPEFSWTLNDGATYVGNFYLFTPERDDGYTNLEVTYKVIYIDGTGKNKETFFTQIVYLN